MSKGIITVLLHTVEYDSENIHDVDIGEIEYEIKEGRSSGTLASTLSAIIPMGNWKIINPEADKWRGVADKMYNWFYEAYQNGGGDYIKSIMEEYEQLKAKE